MGRIPLLVPSAIFYLIWSAISSHRVRAISLDDLDANYVERAYVVVGEGTGDEFTAEQFIVNGQRATIEDHPYHGSLQEFYDGKWHHVCGATLVERNQVLLAAHCLPYWGRRPYRVAFGWTCLRIGERNPGSQVYDLKDLKIFPDFDPCSPSVSGDDIAFGILSKRVNLTEYVRPIGIMSMSGNATDLDGQNCQIVGWGIRSEGGTNLTDNLRKTNVTVISNELCSRFWAIDPEVTITDRMICTLDWPYGRSGVCQGDSGGGLVCTNLVVGAISFNNPVCNGCTPDVHTATASYTRFFRG